MFFAMGFRLRIFLVSAAVGAFFACGASFAAELVPHRALYGLKLGAVRAGGLAGHADGGMELVVEKACDGWIQTQRLIMEIVAANGLRINEEVRFAGWESFDGRNYRFTSRRRSGSRRLDAKGEARAGGAGAALATFKLPEAGTMPLPRDVVFPVGHTALLIERARAGARQVVRPMFDGTDGAGPREVAAFIGPQRQPAKNDTARLGPLVGRPGWTIRLAFYPLGGAAAVPEYEMELLQLDNGVAQHLVLDIGDFSVILELERIERVSEPSC